RIYFHHGVTETQRRTFATDLRGFPRIQSTVKKQPLAIPPRLSASVVNFAFLSSSLPAPATKISAA
ncbi:MAG TPA: hypothetical protein VNX87_02500, partial [Candidatus Sulfotelmatobacter sp.]|nr:hypothetical protein [Candidatus Sulfotelmatobacter sp.]